MKKIISILFLLSILFGLSSCETKEIPQGTDQNFSFPENYFCKKLDQKYFFNKKNGDCSNYKFTSNLIYFGDKKLKNPDLKTFSVEGDYAKDKNYVYLFGELVENADPNSFEFLGIFGSLTLGKDEKNVFLNNKIINGADGKTFEIIGKAESLDFYDQKIWLYSKDKSYVYVNEKILEGADRNTIEFITKNKESSFGVYLRDKDNYYIEDKKISKSATINKFLIDYFLEKYNATVFFEINKDKDNNLKIVMTFLNKNSCAGDGPGISPFWEIGCCHDYTCFFEPKEQIILKNLEKVLQEKFSINEIDIFYREFYPNGKQINIYKKQKYLIGHELVYAFNKDKNLILIVKGPRLNNWSKNIFLFDIKTGKIKGNFNFLINDDQNYKEAEEKIAILIKTYNLNDKFDKTLFNFSNDYNWEIQFVSRPKSDDVYCSFVKHRMTNMEFLLGCKKHSNKFGDEFKNEGFYWNPQIGGVFSVDVVSLRDLEFFFIGQEKLQNSISRLYNSVGFDFYEKKKYQEAISYFEKAIKTDGNYSQAIFNNACSYSILNQKEKSIENLKKLIEIDKANFKEKILKDKDLESIRKSKEFQEILKKL